MTLPSTGDEAVDATIANAVDRIDDLLPSPIASVYLIGSWASGDSTWLSDIDLTLVWRSDAERPNDTYIVTGLKEEIRRETDGRLDLLPVTWSPSAPIPAYWFWPGLIRSSIHLAGPDIRPSLTLSSPVDYAIALARRTSQLVATFRNVTIPPRTLSFPVPTSPFLGYQTRRTWYPKGISQGTKEMVDLAASCASALVAHQASEYIVSKAQALDLFAKLCEKPWASFASAFYEDCRRRWQYQIPDDSAEQGRLRAYCEQLLAFEQHFVDCKLPGSFVSD